MTKKIDEVDAKIIKDLLANARKSFAQIARECKVSTASISERYAELEKEGVIVGSTLQLNYKSLGYDAVCDMIIQAQPQQVDEVFAYLEKIPHVFSPNLYGISKLPDPKFNLMLVAILKDLKELDKTKDMIKRNKFVTDLKTEVWTGIRNTPENLEIMPGTGINKQETASLMQANQEGGSEVAIDEIDLQIIEKLSMNSRMPFGAVAQQIRTSLDTVARRYKRLEEKGVIKASIQIDPTKIGYHANVGFSLAFASQNSTTSVIKKLVAVKDNSLMIKISGDYDLKAFVMVKDIDQLLATRDEVASISGLTRLETAILGVKAPFPFPKEYITTF